MIVAAVTDDAEFFAAAAAACGDLAAGPTVIGGPAARPRPFAHPLLAEATARARRYLDADGRALTLTLVRGRDLADTAAGLARLGGGAGPLGLLLLDGAALGPEEAIETAIEAFFAGLAAAGVPYLRSPHSTLLHRRARPWRDGLHVLSDRFRERVLVSPELLRVEHVLAITDLVARTLDRPRLHRAAERELPSALGDALVDLMCARFGADWLLFTYSATTVAPLIERLDRLARRRGVLSLSAANEHGLACGALAEHLLRGRRFLCVVGPAMLDELRGALANLRSADARGFIVCPEAEPGAWFPFQGTIHRDEDIRDVLAARRLPWVHLQDPGALARDLAAAARHLEAGRGPVVLLVGLAVLAARDAPAVLPAADDPPLAPAIAVSSTPTPDALARALAILDHEPARVLWQLGRLDDEELALADEIAARAGLALVDTLDHPLPTHRQSRPRPHHLGTLDLYGRHQRAFAFLHDEAGRLRPRGEHCVFFLKSRVGERATAFTPARRASLRIVQLTDRADHVAPDAELALVADCREFLRRTLAGLAVDPAVLRLRQAALAAATPAPPDLASRLECLPMSIGRFFAALGELVARMIEDDGYRYTGVYDVGRASVSAARAVPRSDRGFSGWYGRSLLGDAPAALPTLALTAPGDILAFVGDGARGAVADPLPALLENARAYPGRCDRNITIFYLSNGAFSGIRALGERLTSRWSGRQTRTLDLLPPDHEQRVGPLHLVRRTLESFEPDRLRAALRARRRLNVLTVLLAHDDDDDGFGLAAPDWQRDP